MQLGVRGTLTSPLFPIDAAQCTSVLSGYDYYFVPNGTEGGIDQFVRRALPSRPLPPPTGCTASLLPFD